MSEVRDCGKLIQSLKERGIQQMCCFVILLLFNEMQMSVRRFSAIPHLRAKYDACLNPFLFQVVS